MQVQSLGFGRSRGRIGDFHLGMGLRPLTLVFLIQNHTGFGLAAPIHVRDVVRNFLLEHISGFRP